MIDLTASTVNTITAKSKSDLNRPAFGDSPAARRTSRLMGFRFLVGESGPVMNG